MSLNSILNTAVSGLYVSQGGIRTVSQNITNVNTPGYVRVDQTQQAASIAGRGAGVEVSAIRRAADRFLQAAALAANAGLGQADAASRHLDRVQAAFGDPTSDASLFAGLNRSMAAFESAVMDPGSVAARREALAYLDAFLAQLSGVSSEVASTREAAHSELTGQVGEVNSLLQEIVALNGQVMRAQVTGDATGGEQRISDVIDRLSQFMDIKAQQRADGTFEVRTVSGEALAGYTAATLSFEEGNGPAPSYGRLMIQMGQGTSTREFEPALQGGSLKGLIVLRDQQLGEISQTLGEFAGKFTDAINAVHNVSATLPPVAVMSGRDTGLLPGDGLNFSGQTSIAVVNGDGTLARRIDIDFTTGAISVDGAVSGTTGPTIASLAAGINGALGGLGTASFVNGRMTLSATGTGQGLAFAEPATGGSNRAGRAFAHFFGLNDLVTSGRPTSYDTGLLATDAHGFVPGSVIGMRLAGPNGEMFADREVTVPAGTVADLMAALNDSTTGFGLYGGFSLDTNGRLRWAPDPAYDRARLEMIEDSGPRGTTTQSFGQLTGLSPGAAEQRASGLSLKAAIKADPRKLGFAQLQLAPTTVTGNLVVGMTDSRGAQALGAIVNQRFDFTPSLGGAQAQMRLADYLSSLGGDVAMRAGAAESARNNAEALKTDATTRRANVEGVNLDEELVKLSSYQQAYSAAARMITAVDEMFEALLRAV